MGRDDLTAFLDSLVSDSVVPGLVALLVDKDGVQYQHVAGNRQKVPQVLPMCADTLFDLASLSKVVSTTMIAARLADSKNISFDMKLRDIFSQPGNFADVTLFHLLTHTGGFIAEQRLWDLLEFPADVYDYILSIAPLGAPGACYEYSCFGYIILARALEIVTGIPLDRLAKDLVFSPLGMVDTCYNPISSNCASTEFDQKEQRILCAKVHDENARFLGGVAGNAGVFSNAADMALLARMLLSKGQTDQGRFLTPEMVSMFSTDFTINMPVSRSIGFLMGRGSSLAGTVASSQSYGHTGFTGTSIWVDDARDLAAILLTNRVHPSREERRLLNCRSVFHDLAFCN